MFALRRSAAKLSSSVRAAHSLPELPYKYEALEPVISREIMQLHHCKHHQAYVANLNVAEEKLASAVKKGDISTIVQLQPALKFNGGGHINHTFFWNCLSPCASEPSQELCKAINSSFGSLESFREELIQKSVAIQGSGWGWLAFDPKTGCVRVNTTANQDPLQPTTGYIPLFGIDVWEHAYYLQYKNVRADYCKAIFDIVNWDFVSNTYAKAKGC